MHLPGPGPRASLFVALLTCVACSTTEEPPGIKQSSSLQGRWAMRSVEVSHECPQVGLLSPVETGVTNVEMSAGSVVLTAQRTKTVVRYGMQDQGWGRYAQVSHKGCELQGETRWQLQAVGQARFSAFVESIYRASGDCAGLPAKCIVQHRVNGVRR